MPLTDVILRSLKPQPKSYKRFDSGGLYVLVSKTGTRCWRLKYRYGGKEPGPLAFGTYPTVTLKQARARRDEARARLAAGIDPGQVRKAMKAAQSGLRGDSFEAVAREWFAKQEPTWG
jgi:hypothetical protein